MDNSKNKRKRKERERGRRVNVSVTSSIILGVVHWSNSDRNQIARGPGGHRLQRSTGSRFKLIQKLEMRARRE